MAQRHENLASSRNCLSLSPVPTGYYLTHCEWQGVFDNRPIVVEEVNEFILLFLEVSFLKLSGEKLS